MKNKENGTICYDILRTRAKIKRKEGKKKARSPTREKGGKRGNFEEPGLDRSAQENSDPRYNSTSQNPIKGRHRHVSRKKRNGVFQWHWKGGPRQAKEEAPPCSERTHEGCSFPYKEPDPASPRTQEKGGELTDRRTSQIREGLAAGGRRRNHGGRLLDRGKTPEGRGIVKEGRKRELRAIWQKKENPHNEERSGGGGETPAARRLKRGGISLRHPLRGGPKAGPGFGRQGGKAPPFGLIPVGARKR